MTGKQELDIVSSVQYINPEVGPPEKLKRILAVGVEAINTRFGAKAGAEVLKQGWQLIRDAGFPGWLMGILSIGEPPEDISSYLDFEDDVFRVKLQYPDGISTFFSYDVNIEHLTFFPGFDNHIQDISMVQIFPSGTRMGGEPFYQLAPNLEEIKLSGQSAILKKHKVKEALAIMPSPSVEELLENLLISGNREIILPSDFLYITEVEQVSGRPIY